MTVFNKFSCLQNHKKQNKFFSDNQFHILRLLYILPNFSITTNETMGIIAYKYDIYEFPHELPHELSNDLRLKIFRK